MKGILEVQSLYAAGTYENDNLDLNNWSPHNSRILEITKKS